MGRFSSAVPFAGEWRPFRGAPGAILRMFLVLLLSAAGALGQQVIQVRWPSAHTAPPVSFSELGFETSAMIRMGLANLSEETIVSTSLLQGQALGLSAEDASKLRGLFSHYYRKVRQSEPYKSAPSALPYCFSEQKLAQGLATVYVPAKISAQTKTIVFLHGYGGSLLAYLHFLSGTYPNHIIVCPAYGIISDKISVTYVNEAQKAVGARLKTPLRPPLLVGLSAGAFGSFRVYVQQPQSFRGAVCMGAYPPPEAFKMKANRSPNIRFVCGGKEKYVSDGSFQKQMLALQGRTGKLDWKVIHGAGLFFILSHEAQTRKVLLDWERP